MNTDNIHKQVYTFNYLFGVISTPYNELTSNINSNLFNANINNEISKYINTDLDQFSTNIDKIFTMCWT